MSWLFDGEPKETPEEKAKREADEAKWRSETEKRRLEQEEAIRLAVPRDIVTLRKEAAEKLAEAAKLEAMLQAFPNIRKHVGRWNKVAYYSKDVNSKVDRFDLRHNCGCCNDSPLEIWPYLETEHGKVASDPPMFRVGERERTYGGDIPYPDWDKKMQDAGLSEGLIGSVSMHFKRCAKEAREAAAEIYGEESDG